MNFLNSLLGATGVYTTWDSLFGDNGPLGGQFKWVQTLMGVMSTVLWVVLALVGAAGGIYAVYVGIKMARADSAEAREENKKRFINILISIVVVLVLILFFNIFLPMIIGAFVNDQGNFEYETKKPAGKAIINTVRCLIGR